jgi:tRNA threonylcarbamoyladenosine biosynthesis protein TsaE
MNFLNTQQSTLNEKNVQLDDEAQTVNFAEHMAKCCTESLVIYLEGDLGAGKTTFSRGFIQGLGHKGHVKSPTYTLVKPYELAQWRIYHFDLYRLSDPEELEFMGIRDYFADDCICIIEWPDKGQGLLSPADLHITIEYFEQGRKMHICAKTPKGLAILSRLPA